MNLVNAKVEKLVFGGQGLAHINRRAGFIWNALPGEEVIASISKNKSRYCEGTAVRIIKPAPERIAPTDTHFLTCSPWQILKPASENHWKKAIAEEVYRKISGLNTPDDLAIVSRLDQFYHYRNKMEFALAPDQTNKISLAHFQRQSHRAEPIPGCSLLSIAATRTVHVLLAWLNKQKIKVRDLKSLLVRSNQAGQTSAALFMKTPVEFIRFPQLTKDWRGFFVFYSSPFSPANVISREIGQAGWEYLEENIGSKKFRYGLSCFFQINPPLFEAALADMAKFVSPTDRLVDFYAGIGAIGLSLQHRGQPLYLIESFPDAIAYARQNIRLNQSANVQIVSGVAENASDYITTDATVIFDPPRAGLHPKIIKKVLAVLPQKIIYLSCHLATQARDLKPLLTRYRLEFLRLYNFFPRTPHIEGLAVLIRN